MSKTERSSYTVFVKRLLLFFVLLATFSTSVAVAVENEAAPLDSKSSDKDNLYSFKVVHGKRRTTSGATREYALYIPVTNGKLPGPPYPMAVLMHGFLMSGNEQRNNAEYFAQRGFMIFAPNMTKILLGDQTRIENVADVLDHIIWLEKESKTPKSSLSGLVDPDRIAIGGNSSGGAVCLELLAEAQKHDVPVKAMCSLDGVPWDRTWDRVSGLKPVKILSLRAEPSLCNEHARMLTCLQALKFAYDDVKINGAHHCDAENPTTIGCLCICGTTNDKYRYLFARLLYLYLRDTLSAPRFASEEKSFKQVIYDLQRDNQVVAQLVDGKPPLLPGNTSNQNSKAISTSALPK